MTQTRLSVLHVVVRAGATNSQYNEHCLPMLAERRITVCSLFPAEVVPPQALRLIEGDGTKVGCFRALRRALDLGPYDVVHVHAPASGALTLMTYLVTRRSRRNLVFTVHNSWPNFRRRNRLFLYWILALFPVVVTCGRSVRDSLPGIVRTLFGRRISVVQNGVDIERVDRSREQQPGQTQSLMGDVEIVSVNRLIPLKDPFTVLDAFVRAAGDHDRLVLVGDGVLRQELTDAVQQVALAGQVTVTGLVDRDEVYRIISRAGFFVSASRGEGLPVSVLEAMACGCPVILSDIPPHREIAKLAPRIPLFRPGDVNGLTEAMTRMLALKPKGRQQLGVELRRCVEEHFSVRAMNAAYGEIYGDVAAGNAGGGRGRRGSGADDPDLPLMLRARRHWALVLALMVLGGAGGIGYSHVRAPEYHAKSSLVVGELFGGSPTDDSVKASLALAAAYADLARREPVLGPVAEEEGLGDWRTLQNKVHARPGDKNPLLVQLQVTAGSGAEAELIAEAIARRLVAMTTNPANSPGRAFASREMGRLADEIRQTENRIEGLHMRLDATTESDTAASLEADVQDLRRTLMELEASYQSMLDRFVTAGQAGQIQIVEHAYATTSPVRPDPVALTVAGIAAGVMLAVGWLHLTSGSPRSQGGRGRAEVPLQVGGEVRPMRTETWGSEEPLDEQPRREGGRR